MTILNYNVAAQRAATTMTRNDKVMNTAMSRLSTGVKLNQAEDGPATIGVYKGLQVQAVTTRAGIDNINNAISYLRTVDDGGAAIENILIRMKEIAVEAQTGTLSQDQIDALDVEWKMLGDQWDRIVADTKWNGINVMHGTAGAAVLGIGVGSGSTISLLVDDWRSTAYNGDANNSAATQVATGATAVAADGGGTTLAFNFTGDDYDLDSASDAANYMVQVTNALVAIGKSRAELGAQINGLKASANSLVDLADRYESNASAIGDADYAAESAGLATAQIVSQAATAMLAQANAQKGTVLALLK
jgi:flagellin